MHCVCELDSKWFLPWYMSGLPFVISGGQHVSYRQNLFLYPVWLHPFELLLLLVILISNPDGNRYILTSKYDDCFEPMWKLISLISSYLNRNYFRNSFILSNLLFGREKTAYFCLLSSFMEMFFGEKTRCPDYCLYHVLSYLLHNIPIL